MQLRQLYEDRKEEMQCACGNEQNCNAGTEDNEEEEYREYR